MPKRGLTKELLVDTAAELIEKNGKEQFSMRLLAETLEVKTASLYNHIKNMEELLLAVCEKALELQRKEEMQALEGKDRGEAVRDLAMAYRCFAGEHGELYWLVMEKAAQLKQQNEKALYVTEPLIKMMEGYALPEKEKIHFRRFFRSTVHGFLSQERTDFFALHSVDPDESFGFITDRFIESLKQAEKRAKQ